MRARLAPNTTYFNELLCLLVGRYKEVRRCLLERECTDVREVDRGFPEHIMGAFKALREIVEAML